MKLRWWFLVGGSLLVWFVWWVLSSQDSKIIPVQGFTVTVPVPGTIIIPDLRKHTDFRTSQLALVDGRLIPSRKVIYVAKPDKGRFRWSNYMSQQPRIILVIGLDAEEKTSVLLTLGKERLAYAKRHGYGVFGRYIQDFAVGAQPAWESQRMAHIRLLRQALEAFPHAQWFWYLDSHARIRDPSQPLDQLIRDIDKEMIRNQPLIINNPGTHTLKYNTEKDISMVVTQTEAGLSSRSLVIRNTLVARAMLEYMNDPTNQEVAYFKDSSDPAGALLTHVVEWHPRFLKAVALVASHHLGTSVLCTGNEFVCVDELDS